MAAKANASQAENAWAGVLSRTDLHLPPSCEESFPIDAAPILACSISRMCLRQHDLWQLQHTSHRSEISGGIAAMFLHSCMQADAR